MTPTTRQHRQCGSDVHLDVHSDIHSSAGEPASPHGTEGYDPSPPEEVTDPPRVDKGDPAGVHVGLAGVHASHWQPTAWPEILMEVQRVEYNALTQQGTQDDTELSSTCANASLVSSDINGATGTKSFGIIADIADRPWNSVQLEYNQHRRANTRSEVLRNFGLRFDGHRRNNRDRRRAQAPEL